MLSRGMFVALAGVTLPWGLSMLSCASSGDNSVSDKPPTAGAETPAASGGTGATDSGGTGATDSGGTGATDSGGTGATDSGGAGAADPQTQFPRTVGLWHETIPGSTWGTYTDYSGFLQGENGDLGFLEYANDYTNFVGNLLATANLHEFSLGPIYFHGGDPGPSDWVKTPTSNNAFKYLSPDPAMPGQPSQRPMINQYVVEPLQKLGVKQFGLVVTLNPWKPSLPTTWGNPWGWLPSASVPSPVGVPVTTNPTAITLFQLVYELNEELKTSYQSENVSEEDQLYITLLGFDNEAFNVVPPSESCDTSTGTVVNTLWNQYVKGAGYSTASTPQWGITGQSPPFEDGCGSNSKTPVPGSERQFAFIEYYNVPGEAKTVFTFDHPGYVPCAPASIGSIDTQPGSHLSNCTDDSKAMYQLAYGVVSPSLSSVPVPGLERPVTLDGIYSGLLSGNDSEAANWATIWTAISGSEVWKRTPSSSALPEPFIQAAYGMLNQNTASYPKGNLLGLAHQKLYLDESGTAARPGTSWMLSAESFSASYRTLKDPSTQPALSVPITETQLTLPFSSVALKYGPHAPFALSADRKNYLLSQPETGSGTFEAFGGWGLDNLLPLMKAINENSDGLLANFMIYEYAFMQLNDTKAPPKSD